MANFRIQMLVDAELEFETLDQAIEWCNEHTVFDLLDKNASVWGAWIKDADNDDLLADLGR
jgi:hypothetical protein